MKGEKGKKPAAAKTAAAQPSPDTAKKPRPVIQKRSEKELHYLVQAAYQFLGSVPNKSDKFMSLAIKPRITFAIYEFEAGADGVPGHVTRVYDVPKLTVADPSGICENIPIPEYGLSQGNVTPAQAARLLKALGLHNSYKAALDITDYLNVAMNQLNAANISNEKRMNLALTIMETMVNNVTSRRGDKVYLRARSYNSFIKRLESELKDAEQLIKSASYGGVNISLSLQNSLIDAADLANTRAGARSKTTAFKKVIQSVKEQSQELATKTDAEITQLKLFNEEVKDRVATSLLHQAKGNAVALVLKIMEIRQHARLFAREHGIDPASEKPVNMLDLGYPVACFFPSGLRSNRFTIVANDVLKALRRPYQGMEGTRERAQAENDLFHFAGLEYEETTKGNKSRALIHSFNMTARTQGSGKGRVRYWIFENLSDDLLIPKGVTFGTLETEFMAFIYSNFTGSRDKAGELIKFMTTASARLHKEIRRQEAAGNQFFEDVEIKIRLDENYYPQFRTKEENDEAKQIVKTAFAQCGMIATFAEGRGYNMTLKATVTFEGNPQIIQPAKKE